MSWLEAFIMFLIWCVAMVVCGFVFFFAPLFILDYFGLSAYTTHYMIGLCVVTAFGFVATLKHGGGSK